LIIIILDEDIARGPTQAAYAPKTANRRKMKEAVTSDAARAPVGPINGHSSHTLPTSRGRFTHADFIQRSAT
jgi:hypothetical protein